MTYRLYLDWVERGYDVGDEPSTAVDDLVSLIEEQGHARSEVDPSFEFVASVGWYEPGRPAGLPTFNVVLETPFRFDRVEWQVPSGPTDEVGLHEGDRRLTLRTALRTFLDVVDDWYAHWPHNPVDEGDFLLEPITAPEHAAMIEQAHRETVPGKEARWKLVGVVQGGLRYLVKELPRRRHPMGNGRSDPVGHRLAQPRSGSPWLVSHRLRCPCALTTDRPAVGGGPAHDPQPRRNRSCIRRRSAPDRPRPASLSLPR